MNGKKEKKDFLNSIRLKLIELEMELKTDVSGPIIASFGFIIALVWRDAIKSAVDEFLVRAGLVEKAYVYNFVSAAVVTVFVIAIMIMVTRFSRTRRKARLRRKIDRISEKIEERV